MSGGRRACIPAEAHLSATLLNAHARHSTHIALSTGILISHKVFFKSFCKIQIPHKSVNLSFAVDNMKNKLTDLCGNRRVEIDVKHNIVRGQIQMQAVKPGLHKTGQNRITPQAHD